MVIGKARAATMFGMDRTTARVLIEAMALRADIGIRTEGAVVGTRTAIHCHSKKVHLRHLAATRRTRNHSPGGLAPPYWDLEFMD